MHKGDDDDDDNNNNNNNNSNNAMQLHQNFINIAYATGANSVCCYIPLETNCTVNKS